MAVTDAIAAPASTQARARLFDRIPYFVPALAVLTGLVVTNIILDPGFVTRNGWQVAVTSAAPLVVMAMAMTPPILAGGGGIDLSVGPSAGLISVLIAGVLAPRGLTNSVVLAAVAIGAGCVAGTVNGFLVTSVRVSPIIATLSTYLVFSGLATQIMPTPGGVVPGGIASLSGKSGPIPNAIFVVLGVAALWLLLIRTAYWRNLVAVGSNDRAAFTAGVSVARVRFSSFILSGALAGVGGIMLTAVLGGADATVGPTYTLTAIAGAAVGGVSLLGGRGGMLGAAAGGATLFLIQNVLTFVQVSSFALDVAYGVVLVAAIVLNGGWDHLRLRSE